MDLFFWFKTLGYARNENGLCYEDQFLTYFKWLKSVVLNTHDEKNYTL